MICLKKESLWCLCKDQENYYISQLSGSMHTEMTASYKLTEEEINRYLSVGEQALSDTIKYFSQLSHYLERTEERKVSAHVYSEIDACIFS